MKYTIKQASEMTGLSEYTLRYYDKEGLLPLLSRTESGMRKFSEHDIQWLGLINCLKGSGMSIGEIKKFVTLCLKGSETCEERKELLLNHKTLILQQIDQLQSSLQTINYKIAHYKEIGIFHIDDCGQRD